MAKRSKSIKDYTAIGTLSTQLVLKNLPFVFFIAFLTVIYIANAHYSEKTVREIQVLQSELKELRWKYMSLRSELMYKNMYSEVEDRVEKDGLKFQPQLPKKIVVKDE